MTRKNIVKKISETLREVAPDSTAILFGSEARGEARADSDIDVLILLPDNDDVFADRKIEISGRLYDIELSYGVSISPLIVLKRVWNRMKTPFTCNVAKDGILICRT